MLGPRNYETDLLIFVADQLLEILESLLDFCFSLCYLGRATPVSFGSGSSPALVGVTQSGGRVSIPSVTNFTQV